MIVLSEIVQTIQKQFVYNQPHQIPLSLKGYQYIRELYHQDCFSGYRRAPEKVTAR